MLYGISNRLERLPLFWRLNLIGWFTFLVPASIVATIAQRSLERGLGLPLYQLPIEILICWGFRCIYRNIRGFNERSAGAMILLTLLGACIQVVLVQVLIHLADWHNPMWTELEEWLLRLIFTWLMFMGWSLLYFGLKAERAARFEAKRAIAAQEDANRTELQLLRAQLDPHFIFNALNGVAAEILPHPKAALQMVRELAGYLRYTLDRRHDQVSPLGLELDAMQAYLRIEEARFAGLRATIEADARARGKLIPSFLVQPLVENAVKHGRGATDEWELQIAAHASESGLTIETCNAGTLRPDWEQSKGVGLEVLRRRLYLHYPGRHRFSLMESSGIITARLELEGDPCFA